MIDTIEYDGEGWGLCYDGRFLFMSDSSPYLSVRHAETFDLIVRAAVTYQGQSSRRSCSTNWNASAMKSTPTPGIPISSSASTNGPAMSPR